MEAKSFMKICLPDNMSPLEILLGALYFYKIKIISINDNHLKLQNNYEVEVEANGLYKLYDDGYVVAPFTEVNDLCRFILSS